MKSCTPSCFALSLSRFRHVVSFALALPIFSLVGAQAANSFSGAIGYGATTTGGRGGTVYHVTNLNDSGAGSFRDAVSSSGRIIVFDVGGYIHLLSAVSAKSNLTIAGQTAPGDGIGTYGAEVSFYGQSNIIVRNLRFRDGTLDPSYPGSSSTNSHTNCVSLGSTTNVIFDHCSMEFAAYNNVDAVGAVNLTFQNCIFADPIKEQQFNCHFEGGPATFIDNLWANSHGRSPLTKGDAQYVNNIDYNYQYAFCAGNTSGTFNYDIVNNYFISGPSTSSPSDDFYQVPSNCNAYAIGNLLDGNNDGTLNGSSDNSTGATVLSTYYFGSSATIPTTSLPTLTPANAYVYVLSNSGALPHDQVDAQVVANVLSLGTSGQLWVSQTSTGLGNSGYGVLSSGTIPVDSDQDGMPDDWETAKGLNPSSAADAATTSSTGYTNLEDYLNWLALPHAFVAKNTSTGPSSVDIDLTKYAAGFASGSTFTVSSVTGGAVTQSGTGGYLVHYVPTVNTGPVIGGFTFSVTNGSYTMTSTCGVLISSAAAAKNLLWKGDSTTNAWDTTTSNWTNESTNTADTYAVGDRVSFDDTGSHSPAVNITSVISPSSISVETDSSNYTFSGYGWISGTTALVKNGPGTLTIAPTIPTTTGTTTSGSPTVTVTSTANLTVGMPVAGTGISSATTLTAIGSGSITLSKNATASGTVTLSFTPYNTYSGPTTFNAGTILLDAGASLGTGTLNLYSTLTNNAGTNTTVSLANSIAVAAGTSGTINMGNRMSIGGSASGTGTLNLNINTTVTRDDLSGSFTNFGGTINFIGSGSVRLLINSGSFDNFAGAKINLGSSVSLLVYTNSSGNTLTVGELSGSGILYGGGLSGGGAATWSIGALNTSTTFSGSIQDGGSSKAALTKTGTGTLTLTGTSSYTGATTVSGGVLQMNGTLGTTALSVSSGAALGASGTVGGTVAINSGASLYLGTATTAGNTGTLVASGGFTAAGSSTGCNLYYDLSNSPTGSNDKITASAGSLTMSGTVNFDVNLINGVLGAGTYNLIDGNATLAVSGLTMNLVLPVTSGTTRQTFGLSRPSSGSTPGYINLVVTGSAGSLTWTGANGGVWDLNTTASNFSGASPTTFYNLDSVTFDDTSSVGAVTLTGTLQPNVLTVSNNSTAYTLSGSGLIGGATKLVKSGTGTLTLSNTTANTYTGGTTLSAGTLAIGNSASTLGTGLVTISGGTLSLISGASLSNSILITGNSKITSTGNVTIVSSRPRTR
ncbi:MAG: autotransporter-associated beta strand repeat-containing protein [Chthoniobacteraceae bacterium]